jgi:hypothetical protein
MTTQGSLELGPIIGFTDHQSSRIWVRARSESPELWLRYVPAGDKVSFRKHGFGPVPEDVQFTSEPLPCTARLGGYRTGQARLTQLSPNTRYFYEVVSEAELRASPRHFVNERPASFRTLPTGDAEQLSFAFLSCNDVDGEPRRFEPMDMWDRAVRTIVGGQTASFAILGGDQVYADSIEHEARRAQRRGTVLSREHLAQRYGAEYVHFWNWPAIRTFMAHVPCLMMWDDHDIYDGYGSHGNESSELPKALFQAASEAFDLHQGVHNPTPLALGTHKAFGFTLGKRAFLVLDGRSRRRMLARSEVHTESAVLGDDQWGDIKAWLGRLDDVSHLVVVTGVPLVFLPPPRALFSSFASVFGGDDDLRDQWSSPENRIDQLRLIGTLFEFRKRTGASVLSIGGDVHAAAVGTVHSDDRRYLLGNEEGAVIHQLVASGIARRAAPTLLYTRVADEEQRLSDRMVARFGPVHHTRNFAVVGTALSDKRIVTTLHLEGEDAPLKRHLL